MSSLFSPRDLECDFEGQASIQGSLGDKCWGGLGREREIHGDCAVSQTGPRSCGRHRRQCSEQGHGGTEWSPAAQARTSKELTGKSTLTSHRTHSVLGHPPLPHTHPHPLPAKQNLTQGPRAQVDALLLQVRKSDLAGTESSCHSSSKRVCPSLSYD